MQIFIYNRTCLNKMTDCEKADHCILEYDMNV